jgi:plasmid maintenance system antidote protein VapI
MPKSQDTPVEQKLDSAIVLLKHLLAREGVSTQAIAKHLHVATATVVKLLKGVKRNG